MNLSTMTRIRTLAPWRQSSARPVPAKLPLHPAELPREDVNQTKIWDAYDLALANDATSRRASVGCWFVYAPWMHLAWAWHYVGLIHLRTIPGAPVPRLDFPQATHEFVVYALDPNHDVIAEALRPLSPVSIVQQFDAASDSHARLIVEDALELVAQGRCSVDSDFRPTWRHLLRECADRPMAPA